MYSCIVLSSIYLAVQIFADVGTLKIASIMGIAVDAGSFTYPLTFVLRDLVHKRLGRSAARLLIVMAAVINLAMAIYFAFAAALPSDVTAGPSTEYFGIVLGPVWRIVIASIIAEVFAELADTEAYHFWVTRVTRRYQWARVLVSNAISAPLDSVVFVLLAFAGTMPGEVLFSIIVVNILIKGITTLVSLPLIYTIPDSTSLRSSAADRSAGC